MSLDQNPLIYRRIQVGVAASLAMFLAGCATDALDMAPERYDRPWTPSTMASGAMIAGAKSSDGPPNSSYLLPANREVGNFATESTIDASRTYSLAELIDIAESSNPSTHIAWNDARRAALSAGIAKTEYLPRISAAAVGADVSGNSNESLSGDDVNRTNSGHGAISGVSFRWLLYDFGKREAIVDAAKQASLIANIAFTAAHQRVIYAVTLAFYAHASAVEKMKTASQALANAQLIEGAAKSRYAHGTGTVVEAAEAAQSTAEAKLALVQASGAEQSTYYTLLFATGLQPFSKIKIADVGGRELDPRIDESVEAIVQAAIARRPDVLSAYAATTAGQDNVLAAKADFKPKIFMSASAAYNSGRLNISTIPAIGSGDSTDNISGNHFGATVFLGLTVPIYDGGMRSAALSQAEAAEDSAKENLERVKQDAVREIVLADSALKTSLSAYVASKALTEAAQKTFDSSLSSYQHGIGSITAVTTAQTHLLQAQTTSADAYNTSLSAAATLALSTGALGRAP